MPLLSFHETLSCTGTTFSFLFTNLVLLIHERGNTTIHPMRKSKITDLPDQKKFDQALQAAQKDPKSASAQEKLEE